MNEKYQHFTQLKLKYQNNNSIVVRIPRVSTCFVSNFERNFYTLKFYTYGHKIDRLYPILQFYSKLITDT